MTELDSRRLLEKYGREARDDLAGSAEVLQALYGQPPDWSRYPKALSKLRVGQTNENKEVLKSDLDAIKACVEAFATADPPRLRYLLTVLYDMLREDSSCYSYFDYALSNGIKLDDALTELVNKAPDQYCCDKAIWLLTAVIGHVPQAFESGKVTRAVTLVLQKKDRAECTELGGLEGITNLLKADRFRTLVWEHPGVADCVFRVAPSASSPVLYRSVFAIWTLSFDKSITASLKTYQVVQKIKAILTTSRIEKVVRLSLTVLKNFLLSKALSEDIAELGVLEVVTQLEYEKWRDAELYEDIQGVVHLIASEVKELSNFERYQKELESGKLSWGFIHSTKFWAENVMKFEQQEFKALKMLAAMLAKSEDAETLAVACHDLGEFVALHPLGKKKVAELGVKERVMELMSSADPAYREVRREALLCCQKIMLNKWQDIQQEKAK